MPSKVENSLISAPFLLRAGAGAAGAAPPVLLVLLLLLLLPLPLLFIQTVLQLKKKSKKFFKITGKTSEFPHGKAAGRKAKLKKSLYAVYKNTKKTQNVNIKK